MKRFLIALTLLLSLVVVLLGGVFYLFDFSDYSEWITEQIEENTGYEVRFESVESNALQFSVSGVSISLDTVELLHIDSVDIAISEFDLWEQSLQLELIELSGVNLFVDLKVLNKRVKESEKTTQEENKNPSLPWSWLSLNKLLITDFNADIRDEDKGLILQKASLSSENIVVIEKNKLAKTLFLKGNAQLDIQKLDLQLEPAKRVTINDLTLGVDFDVPSTLAELKITSQQLGIKLIEQPDIVVENSFLEMKLDKNRLNLKRFSVDTFSGELQLQAEALFWMNILPTPAYSVEQLTISTLSAKDMKIQIPAFMEQIVSKEVSNKREQQKLPIKSLLVKQIDLQNVDISSQEKQIPLNIVGLNFQLQDFYLLKNNELKNLPNETEPQGEFSLQFDHFQWQDTISEQFDISGKVTEDVRQVLLSGWNKP